ncbi:MAG: pilin [Nitrincola lacisaponensis]|uniref:pilin n=1 Tax=Nitrincola lacisaponensis TaxID=267850 RepID=UPI00391DC2C4
MKKQQGFTLIELMIVVAIIGILAAIALPAYQNYTARAQAAEALTLTAGIRTDIVESISLGATPASAAATALNNAGGASLAGKYVSGIAVAASAPNLSVTFRLDSAVSPTAGQAIMLLNYVAADRRWVCAEGTNFNAAHLPSGCTGN